MMKLSLNERLLIESGINRFRLIGPGIIVLMPWQRKRTKLYVGPSAASIYCSKVLTLEGVPITVSAKVIYKVAPELLNEAILPRVPQLNDGGWQNIVQWQSEALIRRTLAKKDWRDLLNDEYQEELERRLNAALAERLKGFGLEILIVSIIKIELDTELQQTVTQAEQNVVEAGGRARVLKTYFEVFGDDLERAMPLIKDWETLGLLQKNKNLQPIFMTGGLSGNSGEGGAPQPKPSVRVDYNGTKNSDNGGNNGSANSKQRSTPSTTVTLPLVD